jgi:hypothetical protein
MTTTTKKTFQATIAASVAMALSACASDPPPAPAAPEATASAGTVQCKESNSCKGNATCSGIAAGEKHGCKGTNKCANNLRELSKAECDAIKGTVVAAK